MPENLHMNRNTEASCNLFRFDSETKRIGVERKTRNKCSREYVKKNSKLIKRMYVGVLFVCYMRSVKTKKYNF